MFGKISFVVFICSFVVFCESAFVDTLVKCGIADGGCQKDQLQSILKNVASTGVPEYGISQFDPFILHNLTIHVADIFDVNVPEGTTKGVKNCIVNKYETYIEKEKAKMELTCDLVVKGKYKMHGSSPIFQNLLGGATIHGDGKTKLIIDKMHMKFDFHVSVKEKDGEFYIQFHKENLKYSYTLGKVTFLATNLFLGEAEASEFLVKFFNDNWQLVMDTFGKPFTDKAMDILFEQNSKFFDAVPAKHYIIENLGQYVKKH